MNVGLNSILTLEFLSGTDLEDAIKEAKDKAGEFKLAYVRFMFNNIEFSVSSKADVLKMVSEYQSKTLRSGYIIG